MHRQLVIGLDLWRRKGLVDPDLPVEWHLPEPCEADELANHQKQCEDQVAPAPADDVSDVIAVTLLVIIVGRFRSEPCFLHIVRRRLINLRFRHL